jgi:hypothetical protein
MIDQGHIDEADMLNDKPRDRDSDADQSFKRS